MTNVEVKDALVLADLNRELARVQEARKKQFAAIVRFVQLREAKGPAKDMMEQIRRDNKLCRLLVDLEDQSEIIAMTELVRDLTMKQSRRKSRRHSTNHSITQEYVRPKR
jgi:hypothetical protein